MSCNFLQVKSLKEQQKQELDELWQKQMAEEEEMTERHMKAKREVEQEVSRKREEIEEVDVEVARTGMVEIKVSSGCGGCHADMQSVTKFTHTEILPPNLYCTALFHDKKIYKMKNTKFTLM